MTAVSRVVIYWRITLSVENVCCQLDFGEICLHREESIASALRRSSLPHSLYRYRRPLPSKPNIRDRLHRRRKEIDRLVSAVPGLTDQWTNGVIAGGRDGDKGPTAAPGPRPSGPGRSGS